MTACLSKLGRYAIHVTLFLAFISALNSSSAAEQAPIIYAFYCPSEEIAFIGELMPSVLSTVEDDKVKAELGLSNAQIGKMKETDNAFFAGINDVLGHNENKERDQMANGRRIQDTVMAIGKLSEDARKRTNEIMKPHQLARMQELLLQRYGLLFIPKKDLRQVLRLEMKQERAIDEIRSGVFKRIDETAAPDSVIASSGRCKFVNATNRDIVILLRESEKTVQRLLSPEQRNTLNKLRGKEFFF